MALDLLTARHSKGGGAQLAMLRGHGAPWGGLGPPARAVTMAVRTAWTATRCRLCDSVTIVDGPWTSGGAPQSAGTASNSRQCAAPQWSGAEPRPAVAVLGRLYSGRKALESPAETDATGRLAPLAAKALQAGCGSEAARLASVPVTGCGTTRPGSRFQDRHAVLQNVEQCRLAGCVLLLCSRPDCFGRRYTAWEIQPRCDFAMGWRD